MDFIGKWFNLSLMSQPMNWLIVSVIATIWLLAFHVVMQGFSAMTQSGDVQDSISGGPGTVAASSASTATFSAPGTLADGFNGQDLGSFVGGATMVWTDGFESKYAEDGWGGNS